MSRLRSRFAAAFGVALALGLLMADPADARRGGSFGSRGYRTYSAPAPTRTAPGYTAPVQRSMTPNSGYGYGGAYAPRPGYGYNGYNPYYRPRPFGGFGGFMGGLITGGLIGGLFGHHWGGGWGGYGWGGGGGGLITVIIQLVILGLILSFVMRMFRRRSAYASPFAEPDPGFGPMGGPQSFGGPFGGGGFGGGAVPPTPTPGPGWEYPITPADQADFERLLREVQDCYAREDYAGLRERCTPEVMGYLAEELSDNATHGRKNEVRDLRLLQADVGEAWREGQMEYATASMRYESIDVMRDRTSGAVLSGDPNRPTQTVEIWTFVRPIGGAWKLSAIQEAN